MIKKKFIIFAILLIFLNGCGYSPIFSKKNNFSIIELKVSGNKEINKIIINSLNYYKVSEGENKEWICDLEITHSQKDSKI